VPTQFEIRGPGEQRARGFPNGCIADYDAGEDMIGNMKGAQRLVVQAINGQGQAISLALPLNDFGKAYDGPPSDPKGFEPQQK
jgi:invasion protein IalB